MASFTLQPPLHAFYGLESTDAGAKRCASAAHARTHMRARTHTESASERLPPTT